MGTTEEILRHSAVPNLDQLLGRVSPRELQTALINDSERRAGVLAVNDVMRQYEANPFTEPCELSQREVLRFGAFVAEKVPAQFDMVELSPVTAFGSNSVLANISQKTVLTTSRNTEVVADGVTALTLETASRRRANPALGGTHLATLHRELRTQQHEQPGFTAHFHALSLVSSERVAQPDAFKADVFNDHTKAYLDIIHQAKTLGYDARKVAVALSSTRIVGLLVSNLGLDKGAIMRHTQTPGFDVFNAYNIPLPKIASVSELADLAESLPASLAFLKRPLLYMGRVGSKIVDSVASYGDHAYFDLSRHAGIGYYQDMCVKISAANNRGEYYPLVDIGSHDWLAKATGNKADRLITGGMGTELFMKKFKQ